MVSSIRIRPVDKSTRKTFPTHPPYFAISIILLVTSCDTGYKPQPFPVKPRQWVRPEAMSYLLDRARTYSSKLQQDRPPRTWVSHCRASTLLLCRYLNRKTSFPKDMSADTFYNPHTFWRLPPGRR